MSESTFSPRTLAVLQQLRRGFYARRDGVLADALRRRGAPYDYVMGCWLPDVVAVSAEVLTDSVDVDRAEVGRALWADRRHRECRLAAPMVFPTEAMTIDEASVWLADVQTQEEADVLCHRLLRKLPYAVRLVERFADDDRPMVRYGALRLLDGMIAAGGLDNSRRWEDWVCERMRKATGSERVLLRSIEEALGGH